MTDDPIMQVVSAANHIGFVVVREPDAFGVINSQSW
jgi:hypothetical protein